MYKAKSSSPGTMPVHVTAAVPINWFIQVTIDNNLLCTALKVGLNPLNKKLNPKPLFPPVTNNFITVSKATESDPTG